MFVYDVFGGTLASELELPELRAAPGPAQEPTWTLRVRSAPAPPDTGWVQVAEDDVGDGVTVGLYEGAGALRLRYSDTGDFEVSAGGSRIDWYAAEGASLEYARLDIIGRVITVALQMNGTVCLHASAVAVGNSALGFLGSKGYGKSTLATALTYAGARLVTDDTLALLPGTPVVCVPGVQSVRLRHMAAGRFERTRDRLDAERPWNRVIDTPPDALVMTEGAPLGAIYILSPAAPDAHPLVKREPLEVLPAALALVGHDKLGALRGAAQSVAILERAIRVAESVPVYSLVIARDLERIDAAARSIVEWHRVPTGAAEAPGS
jgi:hypothetical protein